jgi:type II secretory pathway pseudopilin PulG
MNEGWDRVRRAGFTIIEVMLFLAISGFLFVGILVGTGSGISRQRYNDSVQDIARILREQYSSVVNVQIPERDSNDSGACYSPSPDDLLSGGKITGGALSGYYDTDGNLKDGGNGRGRTSCLVYGVMVTLGGKGGTVAQSSTLVGKDIDELVREDPTLDVDHISDLEILRLAGVNNLSVYYDVSGSGGVIDNWQCWVRTTSGSVSHNLQWEAKTETVVWDEALKSTLLIIRSPKDGAVKTYVMDSAITYRGEVVDYADINSKNGGKGYGLQSENSGACNGTISPSQGGFQLLKEAGVNSYLTDTNFKKTELDICVGSGDVFAFANKRRMIQVAKDGHNSGAIELIDMDSGDNKCQ